MPSEPGSPGSCSSQLSRAGGTPGGAGSERRKRASREPLTEADGARRPFVCDRGAGALRPVAPALARPSSRRLPDSPARARPPPVLPPPRLRPQPRPCPGPRAPTCCGGDSWSPGDRTGDHPAGTQTRRRPLLSTRASAPLRGRPVSGQPGLPAEHLLLRAPVALAAGPSPFQGLEVPSKPGPCGRDGGMWSFP